MRRSRAFTWLSYLALLAPPAGAVDLFVDATADAVDALPGDGACATAAGTCTLRAAIQEANALPGADVVRLSAGVHVLEIAGAGEDGCASGDLDVTDELRIQGAGADLTTIDAVGIDRILQLTVGAALTIEDVTLTGGVSSSGGAVAASALGAVLALTRCVVRDNRASSYGGALSGSRMVLDSCVLERNQAPIGGAVGADRLTARSTLIADCSATESSFPFGIGGAILAYELDLVDCSFERNIAGQGGAVYLYSVAPSMSIPSSMVNCRFEENSAIHGGALLTDVGGLTLSIAGSTFARNVAELGGAAYLQAQTTLDIEGSNFEENVASDSGGAIMTVGFLDTGHPGVNLTLDACRFARNHAVHVGGALLGASSVNIRQTQMIVRDCLFDENSAGDAGGAIALAARGRDVGLYTDLLTMANSTVTRCVAPEAPAVLVRGLFGAATLRSVTITECVAEAGSAAVVCAPAPPQPPFPYNPSTISIGGSCIAGSFGLGAGDLAGPITSLGFNLVGDDRLVAWSGDTASLLRAADPRLGELQDNGGPTPSHLPLPGSALLDANPAACLDENGDPLDADQRGLPRPTDDDGDGVATCDIGAVEGNAGADSDGDGIGDGLDCRPADPSVFAPPIEPTLDVTRAPGGAVAVSWSDVLSDAGTSTTVEVASDSLASLQPAGVAAPCVAIGLTTSPWLDAGATPPGGAYYLARAVNACGPPPGRGWGRDSFAIERPACP